MFRQRYPDVHILTRETNTREQIVPLSEGARSGAPAQYPTAGHPGVGAGAARAVAGDGPGRPSAGPPALGQPGGAGARTLRLFDPHVGTGLYDDILGLLRRYGHTPVIAQEVGRR